MKSALIRRTINHILKMVFLFGITAFSWLWLANSGVLLPVKEIILAAFLLVQTGLLLKMGSLYETLVNNLIAGFIAGVLLCLMSAFWFPNLFSKLESSAHFLQLCLFEGSCFAGIYVAYGLLVFLIRQLQLKICQRN